MTKSIWGRVAHGLHKMADDVHAKKAGAPRPNSGPQRGAPPPRAAPQGRMPEETCPAPMPPPPPDKPAPQNLSEQAPPDAPPPSASSDGQLADNPPCPSSFDALRLPPPSPPPCLRRPSSPLQPPADEEPIDEDTEDDLEEAELPPGPICEDDDGDCEEEATSAELPRGLPRPACEAEDDCEKEATPAELPRGLPRPTCEADDDDDVAAAARPRSPTTAPSAEAALALGIPPLIAPSAMKVPTVGAQTAPVASKPPSSDVDMHALQNMVTSAIAQALESLEARRVRDALHVLLTAQQEHQAMMLEAVQQVRAECNDATLRLTAAVERLIGALERDQQTAIPAALSEVGEQVRVSVGEVNGSLRALSSQNKHIIAALGIQAVQNERVVAVLEQLATTAAPQVAAPEPLPKLAVIDGGGLATRHAPAPSDSIYERIPDDDLED